MKRTPPAEISAPAPVSQNGLFAYEPRNIVIPGRFTDGEIKMMTVVTAAEGMSLAELVHTAVAELLARRGF